MSKYYVLILLFFFQPLLAKNNYKEIVTIDNEYFQSYKGKLGKWVRPYKLSTSIYSFIRKIGSSEKEVKKLNSISPDERIPLQGAVFFPYSTAYIKKLLQQGKGRKIIKSDIRELIWPIGTSSPHVFISSRLGMRHLGEKTGMHRGVDIACSRGTPILAAGDGEVITIGTSGNYGNSILIRHKINNIHTLYAHNSVLLVKEGDRVKKGQIIALAGSTGRSTGSHLHFEVRYQDIVLNPEHYFTPPGDEFDEKVVMHEKIME